MTAGNFFMNAFAEESYVLDEGKLGFVWTQDFVVVDYTQAKYPYFEENDWFNYNGIANTIDLHSVKDYLRILYSTRFDPDQNTCIIIKPDNTKIMFTISISSKGLYLLHIYVIIHQKSVKSRSACSIKLCMLKKTLPNTQKGG